MGNRAVITTSKEWKNDGIGVYVHWNGGRDSVEAFLTYCEMKGYRAPDQDCYGWARLCQVLGNFFGGSTSVGIDKLWYLDKDNGDNGVYVIEGWKIVDRIYHDGPEQHGYDLGKMLKAIDERMPEGERFGDEFWEADLVDVADLEVGDVVFVPNWDGSISKETVSGIGVDKFVNGTRVFGIPYVNKYASEQPENNINNYLQNKSYRRIKAK